jgi:hypothetical protein
LEGFGILKYLRYDQYLVFKKVNLIQHSRGERREHTAVLSLILLLMMIMMIITTIKTADVKVRMMMMMMMMIVAELLLLLLLNFPSLISQFNSTMANYCANPAPHRYNKNLFVKFRFFKYFLSFMWFYSESIAK